MSKYSLYISVETSVNPVEILGNYDRELDYDVYNSEFNDTYFDSYIKAKEYIKDGGNITLSMLNDYYKNDMVQAIINQELNFEEDIAHIKLHRAHFEITSFQDEDLCINPLNCAGITEENAEEMIKLFDNKADFIEVDLGYAYSIQDVQITGRDEEDPDILYGTVDVNMNTYSFEYDYVGDLIEYHNYSEPGYITGASYEKPLPPVFNDDISWHLIGVEVGYAAQEYIKEQELKEKKSLNEQLANCQPDNADKNTKIKEKSL